MKITKEEFVRRQQALILLHTRYADQIKTDSSNIEAIMAMNKEIQKETDFITQVFIED